MGASPPTRKGLEVGTSAEHPRARVQEQQVSGLHTEPLLLQKETGVEKERVHRESAFSINYDTGQVVTGAPGDPSRGTSRHEVKEGNRAGPSGIQAPLPATAIPSSAKPEPASRSESLPSEGKTTHGSSSVRSSLMGTPTVRSLSTDVPTEEEDTSLIQPPPAPLTEPATTANINEKTTPCGPMDRTTEVSDTRLSETRSMASLSTVRETNEEATTPVQDAPGTQGWERILTSGDIADSPIEAPQSHIPLNKLTSVSTASRDRVEEGGAPRPHTGSALVLTTAGKGNDKGNDNLSGEISSQVRRVGLLELVI